MPTARTTNGKTRGPFRFWRQYYRGNYLFRLRGRRLLGLHAFVEPIVARRLRELSAGSHPAVGLTRFRSRPAAAEKSGENSRRFSCGHTFKVACERRSARYGGGLSTRPPYHIVTSSPIPRDVCFDKNSNGRRNFRSFRSPPEVRGDRLFFYKRGTKHTSWRDVLIRSVKPSLMPPLCDGHPRTTRLVYRSRRFSMPVIKLSADKSVSNATKTTRGRHRLSR